MNITIEISQGIEVSFTEETVIDAAFELGLIDDYEGVTGFISYSVGLDDSVVHAYDVDTLFNAMFEKELTEKLLIDIREAAADKLLTAGFQNMIPQRSAA